jgi:hypothetical protein
METERNLGVVETGWIGSDDELLGGARQTGDKSHVLASDRLEVDLLAASSIFQKVRREVHVHIAKDEDRVLQMLVGGEYLFDLSAVRVALATQTLRRRTLEAVHLEVTALKQ